MSSEDIILPRGHRHTRSAAAVHSASPPSQHPHNPHHLNTQGHSQDGQSGMSAYPTQPTTPPRTPRRDNQHQNHNQNANNSNAREPGSKQKARKNKNRPKNVMTSPAVKANDRTTPPLNRVQSAGTALSSKPINTPSNAVYAGATFHASPAPSALPIPSFYSKSVPESPGIKALKAAKEADLAQPRSSRTPPAAPSSGRRFQREESPLDLFFKADREEKARAQSAGSAHIAGDPSGPFQPPPRSALDAQTPPAQTNPNHARKGHASKPSGSGIFAMDLDGPYNPGTPIGPAFSTPYSERINAAKSTSKPNRVDSQQALERSEALKAYLFSGHNISPPPATNATAARSSPLTPASSSHPHYNNYSPIHNGNASNGTIRNTVRSSNLRQQVTPTKTPDRNTHYSNSITPSRNYGNASPSNPNNPTGHDISHATSPPALSPYGASSGNGTSDLQGMEDSLRRILKLDPARSPCAPEAPIKSTTAGSVPNYASGRVPHIPGTNNGFMRS
ncbi:uncharacterized protein BP5553_07097 [Venustampulla echinocandica]|uniref:Proteophosphoglycan 5 n=1 Tax=Venustampulla echinocandica TaxID=2656787 RepID=A0A370TII0_9HELO|nr:uncharacterized protein BP5553_07097 [Venustampulla echinocandica]RDL35166.1 hypothetical protein BP5553_07097 [Venustampulla echinocandica]